MCYILLHCVSWCKGRDIRPKDVKCFYFKHSYSVALWMVDRRTIISRHKNLSIQFNSIQLIQPTLSHAWHWICQTQFITHIHIVNIQFWSHINTLKSQFTIHIYNLKTQNSSTSTIKYNTLYNTALYQHYLIWIWTTSDKNVLFYTPNTLTTTKIHPPIQQKRF